MMSDVANPADLKEAAAFERGRIQGEMEAMQRVEADAGLQLKQTVEQPVANMQRPDVIEINRLTWLQRAAALLGEGTAVAYVVLTVLWLDLYRGDIGWSNEYAGDNIGDVNMFNSHILANSLGLFCFTQAILLYRVFPLNLAPWLNRVSYLAFQSAAISAFMVSLAAVVKSTPEMTFWGVDHWCFAVALAVSVTHALYSMTLILFESLLPITYQTWAENGSLLESAEQTRDRSQFNQGTRTIYTPAPVSIPRESDTVPPPNSNVGAQVPVAPANAPRWAENPNTHAENYFLLPRAKWAVCGFVAMGAAILMAISALEHILAAGRNNWSQDNTLRVPLGENSNEARLVGALGVVMLLSVVFVAYAAMPPRTTFVKNGILTDPARRGSVSHNAETKLHYNIV